jgi:hypothetical protein
VIPGTKLASVSSRFLRAETFDLMVSPAIADLQFEIPCATRLRRLQTYAGVWRAFLGALGYDIVTTVRAPFEDEARRVVWQSNLLMFAGLAFFQACYYACMATLLLARTK